VIAQEIWNVLSSGGSHDRLRAAREVALNAGPEDREKIVAALSGESVSWVRHALSDGLIRASGGMPPLPVETTPWDDSEPEDGAYARGLEDATRSILHEINPLLGLLRVSASREIESYDSSRTRRTLDRLLNLVKGITQLNQAASALARTSFNLPEKLKSVCVSVSDELSFEVQLAGPDPHIVLGNPDLIDLVISNAVRNAVEAQQAAGVRTAVLVVWDSTDREFWISVLDRGIGLPPGSQYAFDRGISSKAMHAGLGLAIAQRAAHSLMGKLKLSPRDGGGTAFELRWPRGLKETG
jgi:signal transduction histidine kinase